MGDAPEASMLRGVRIIEVADEQAEYTGLLLAGLGAEVIKVEPPGGSLTRRIGPFYQDRADPESSLYFWHYNRAKRSIVLDLGTERDRAAFRRLAAGADVVLDSTAADLLPRQGVSLDSLREAWPALITARMTPFGDSGPWAGWRGSDLVHLALGGVMMNCGYDPRPDGTYDLPPIAPQMWHAYHIAGELTAMMIVAALVQRQKTGRGQHLSSAIHEAVAKCTEMDLSAWTMRALPFYRQTCRHAHLSVSTVPTIVYTKDGRWILCMPVVKQKVPELLTFLKAYGMEEPLRTDFERLVPPTGGPAPELKGRYIPGSSLQTDLSMLCHEALQRLFAKFTFQDAPWREAQEAGILVSPLRRPEENVDDPHWRARRTFTDVEHPELGRSLTYITGKWVSDETSWAVGRRAPRLDEDRMAVEALGPSAARAALPAPPGSAPDRPFPLAGVRVFDFSWFLATAGGTRYLAALGAEVIKVEWKGNPDSRLALAAMAPQGGRAARDQATGPLPAVTAAEIGDDYQNMGGQFHLKNPGKRGISLNVRDPRGLAIARRLIATSDIVAEGFSPGVLEKWGLGYEALQAIRPDIIYVKQSGMGSRGTYGRLRTVGPIAAAFAGNSEQSGLPAPALPVGWGYSYLDWMGAYSFALAIISALYYRNVTGRGQRIDASQCEAGLFVAGTSYLDWAANGRPTSRTGNRSPYKPAAPHGAYRCAGPDAWLAIACFQDQEWRALCRVAGHDEWRRDPRFAGLADRLAHQDELDQLVSGWTAGRDAVQLMTALQEAGVPAGVCQTAADRCDNDPQLRHLGWMTELPGTKIGTWPVPEVPVRMSGATVTVGGITGRGAPTYGEDNAYVYGQLLGMSEREIAQLAADDVI